MVAHFNYKWTFLHSLWINFVILIGTSEQVETSWGGGGAGKGWHERKIGRNRFLSYDFGTKRYVCASFWYRLFWLSVNKRGANLRIINSASRGTILHWFSLTYFVSTAASLPTKQLLQQWTRWFVYNYCSCRFSYCRLTLTHIYKPSKRIVTSGSDYVNLFKSLTKQ